MKDKALVVSGNIFEKSKASALTSETFAGFIEKNGIDEFYIIRTGKGLQVRTMPVRIDLSQIGIIGENCSGKYKHRVFTAGGLGRWK